MFERASLETEKGRSRGQGVGWESSHCSLVKVPLSDQQGKRCARSPYLDVVTSIILQRIFFFFCETLKFQFWWVTFVWSWLTCSLGGVASTPAAALRTGDVLLIENFHLLTPSSHCLLMIKKKKNSSMNSQSFYLLSLKRGWSLWRRAESETWLGRAWKGAEEGCGLWWAEPPKKTSNLYIRRSIQ